ncbi:MAG: chorismate-binding protein [Bacteroidia bacterium]|nr:chorismate-binding protein [Bacteroidia bacterium]NND25938.1 isochorismate synthase [Flavobacteriaceae bacterium]MBT8278871.1 chorismate-binding protein [Bacteroidia bacterium]NNK60777.1 isochorismate synthase [Flavobacteriaceae bacterium]NNL33532.1 isochorismate synthase [Flavobacteriaceae bacterium]
MLEEAFFKGIQDHLKTELPFVVYRKPNEIEVHALLQKDDLLYKINDYSESGFVFSPFDFRKDSLLIPYSKSTGFSISRELFSESTSVKNTFQNQDNKDDYIELVQKAIIEIRRKRFQKIVLSRKASIPRQINVIQTLIRLLNSYKSAFVYCWYHPKVGLWLGATPETLMKVEGNRFTTMALAGTQRFTGSLSVEWSDKDKKEQQFVTDYILTQISETIDNIIYSDLETIRAGQLLHLKTDISGTISSGNTSLQELILLLHPTPAVCGTPKNESRQYLIDNEGYNREFYTGFLGELNKEVKIETRSSKRNIESRAYNIQRRNSELFVNLRCLQSKANQAFIYIGGGITADSEPLSEWQETVEKAKTMEDIIVY